MKQPTLYTNKTLSKLLFCIVQVILFSSLISCSNNHRPAPVRNLSIEPQGKQSWQSNRYKVRKKDSLYSIAFKFGVDFQQLASINSISSPYTIYPGQSLQLRYSKPKKVSSKARTSKVQPVKRKSKPKFNSNKKPKTNRPKTATKKSNFDLKRNVENWQWPVKKHSKARKGSVENPSIVIKGQVGDSIYASAAGRVVYSGNGLVGYGNLIIIKHSQSLLSAYAHNDRLIVSEKDIVKKGQRIATMGKNETGITQLQFEIRKKGKPVNPLKYLPAN